MRVFVALDIQDEIRRKIADFARDISGFAPDARWVGPETLHVTLKFAGEVAVNDVERMKECLSTVHADAFQINFSGHGFFPSAKNPRVFWAGVHANESLAKLAATVDEAVACVGIARETHPYSPHLTLARARGGSGAPYQRARESRSGNAFAILARKMSTLSQPDFGTMTASEFFLYESKLSPRGAQCTKLARFPLGTHGKEPAKNA